MKKTWSIMNFPSSVESLLPATKIHQPELQQPGGKHAALGQVNEMLKSRMRYLNK